jgi:hypothetical protein
MLSKCESHKITKNGAELLIYRRPYPKETVTRIIYGCRMSSNHKEILRTQLRAWEFANCSLEELSLNAQQFAFESHVTDLAEASTPDSRS